MLRVWLFIWILSRNKKTEKNVKNPNTGADRYFLVYYFVFCVWILFYSDECIRVVSHRQPGVPVARRDTKNDVLLARVEFFQPEPSA